MQLSTSLRLPALTLFVTALAVAGCGKSKATVSGKVTYQNKPVKGGNISFVSSKGAVSGEINEDGTYTVDGVPTGEARISVDTESINPQIVGGGQQNTAPKGVTVPSDYQAGGGTKVDPKRYVKIPEKYADPDTSDLTFKVGSGSNTYDIDLK